MDNCAAGYVATPGTGLCDCVISQTITKILNPTDNPAFIFNPFVCCAEGQVNQATAVGGGVGPGCVDNCAAGFAENAVGLCVPT